MLGVKRIGKHLRGNAVAYLALFVALGSGTALAANQLAKHSVGTKQLRKNAVVSSKVKDFSLQAKDFANGQLPAGKQGATGKQGKTGKTGGTGKTGPTGPVGPTQGFAFAETSGATPPKTPERTIFERVITLNGPGRLFAFARGTLNIACSAGTNVGVGLYVDGDPVTAGGQEIAASTFSEISVWGLSGNETAGKHTLSLQVDCSDGSFVSGSNQGDSALGAILVGS